MIEDCMCETGRLPYLWNRGKSDEDFLVCRVGIGNIPFNVPIAIPKERFSVTGDSMKELPLSIKKKYEELKEVPVCINLEQERLFGVIADNPVDFEELLWMLALQIGILGSISQIRLIILLTRAKTPATRLAWLRFIPHLHTGEEHLLALDMARAKELIHRAEKMMIDPEEQEKYWIIFTDDYTLLRQSLINNDNVSVMLFVNNYEELPSVCNSILLKSTGFSGQIKLKADVTFRRELRFDSISRELAEKYARTLCGLAFRTGPKVSEIPKKVTILELFGDKINYEAIRDEWIRSRSEDSLCVEIGVTQGGRCFLDPHECGHGPHGLIAGMTGSGKSEMLQTIILSLPYFEDDYFGLLLREDMERTVSNLSALEESEIKVYIKRFLFPDFFYTFKNDDTLETVKNAGNTLDADYYIFIKAVDMDMAYGEEFREQTETLFMQMALITQPGLVRVYALRENTFNEIDRGNFETYLNDYYRADMDQCIAVARKVVKVDE